MNNKQLAAGRAALFPTRDRVKLRIERDGETATLTPYLIDNPEQSGTPVSVMNNVTPERQITNELAASIRVLLG